VVEESVQAFEDAVMERSAGSAGIERA